MIEFISQPWHWAISGLAITVIMILLLLSGERFGISTSFETMCSIGGAGKIVEHFRFDWRKHSWLLVFIAGTVIGGYLGSTALQSPEPVRISENTVEHLKGIGITPPVTKEDGLGFAPMEIFNFKSLATPTGFIMLIVGGFLIGFGTRWASGCTSGHAISGLANLQLASLIATVGFFIGGLITTHFLLPVILNL